jgi:hypothetical protein
LITSLQLLNKYPLLRLDLCNILQKEGCRGKPTAASDILTAGIHPSLGKGSQFGELGGHMLKYV